MKATATDYPVIYLQPECDQCRGPEDRTWCRDNVWTGDDCCPDCGRGASVYTLKEILFVDKGQADD